MLEGPRGTIDPPTHTELLAACGLAVSGFTFIGLVVGNYLVFSPNPSAQSLGSDFLFPFYYFSVSVLHVSPFDEGLWAFSGFSGLLLSITVLRARGRGMTVSLLDSFTLVAPAILVCFELGVYLLIPAYFYSQVTNFEGNSGLGTIVTNVSVLAASLAVLLGRLLFKRLHLSSWKGVKSGG